MPRSNTLKPNAIVPAMATVHDYFPSTLKFDLGQASTPLALVPKRRQAAGAGGQELLLVCANGELQHLTTPEQGGTEWAREVFPLPELRNATVWRADAVVHEALPGGGDDGQRLLLAIAAMTVHKQFVLVMLEHRPGRGWARLPASREHQPWNVDAQFAVACSGFVALPDGGSRILELCATRAYRERRSGLGGYLYHGDGHTRALLFDAPLQGIDRLLALGEARALHLARLEGDSLAFFPAGLHADPDEDIDAVRVRVDLQAAQRLTLPARIEADDASAMTPLVAPSGTCAGLLLVGKDGGLTAVQFGESPEQARVEVLSGRADGPARVTEVTYSFAGDGALRVYAVGDSDLVWFGEWDLQAGPAALRWTPTGQQARAIKVPAHAPGTPAVFELNDAAVVMYAHAGEGEVWGRSEVCIPAQAAAEPASAVVHQISLSPVTVLGQALPDVALAIRSRRPATIEYQGKLWRLTAERPFLIRSGETGSASFRFREEGIEAPEILVSLPDEPHIPEACFRPHDGALRRLAGLDRRFTIDPAQLTAAGVLPDTIKPADAASLTQVLQTAALKALHDGADHPAQARLRRTLAGAPARHGVAIVARRTEAGLVFHHPTQAELAARPVAASAGEPSTFARFWSWFKQCVHKVVEFVVHVVEEGVRLIVKTVDAVHEFLSAAASQIVQGVDGFLNWVGTVANKAVDIGKRFLHYLGEVLGWDDVLRCKDLVKACIRGTLIDMEALVGETLPVLLSSRIGAARERVDQLMQEAIGKLAGRKTCQADPQGGINVMHGAQDHGGKALSFHHAVPGGEAKFHQSFSQRLKDRLETLLGHVREFAQGDKLVAPLQDLLRLFDGKTSLADGLGLLLSDLLVALRPLVLMLFDVADILQTLLFEVLAEIIRLVREFLEAPVLSLSPAMGWVNSLYRGIAGADLSVLDLACLLFTAPGVLVYHALTGKKVLAEGDRSAEQLVSGFAVLRHLLQRDAGALRASAREGEGALVRDAGFDAELEAMRKQIDDVYPILAGVRDICYAAWYGLLRGPISAAENGMRVVCLSKVAQKGTGFLTWLGRIAFVVDWGLAGYAGVLAAFNSNLFWEKLAQDNSVIYLLAAGAVAAIGVPLLLAINTQLPADMQVWIWSFVSVGSGLVLGAWHIFWLAKGLQPAPGSKPGSKPILQKDVDKYYFEHSAGLLLQVRKLTQLGLPVGYEVTQKGGALAPVGAVMMGASATADAVIYFAGGVMAAIAAAIFDDIPKGEKS